jgi:hypothetical protein
VNRRKPGVALPATRGAEPAAGDRGAMMIVLGDSPCSYRAMQWACDEAAHRDRRLSSLVLLRRQWWEGIGAATPLPVAEAVARETADALRLHYGLDLLARGYDVPRAVMSARDVCEIAVRRGAVLLVAPARLGRRLRRPAARRGLRLMLVP